MKISLEIEETVKVLLWLWIWQLAKKMLDYWKPSLLKQISSLVH
jgi:hypothetical protein